MALSQGPVNLPPEAAGLRQALRKMHSYMWLEDAIADEGNAQAPGARRFCSSPSKQSSKQASKLCPMFEKARKWSELLPVHNLANGCLALGRRSGVPTCDVFRSMNTIGLRVYSDGVSTSCPTA